MNIDLAKYYPFNRCSERFTARALQLGSVRLYRAGEVIRPGHQPVTECGLILSGEAIAFESDPNAARYRLCLSRGCFFGLEALDADVEGGAKITALSETAILVWEQADMDFLCENSVSFAKALERLSEGSEYQRNYLIPETDTADPLLCVVRPHPATIVIHCGLILLGMIALLAAFGQLSRYYSPALILMILSILGAGFLIFRSVKQWMGEQWLITAENLIRFDGKQASDPEVTPLAEIESCETERVLLNIGRLKISDGGEGFESFYLEDPDDLSALLRGACRSLPNGKDILQQLPVAIPEEVSIEAEAEENNGSNYIFRAHWARLVALELKPLLLTAGIALLMYFSRNSTEPGLYKLWIIAFLVCAGSMIYQFIDWRNDLFIITEDAVKDYNRKPLQEETVNVAMLDTIQSVRFEKKSIFQLLFDYGTVFTLAGLGELSFDYVGHPQKIQDLILEQISKRKESLRLEEENRQHAYLDELADKIRGNSDNNHGDY